MDVGRPDTVTATQVMMFAIVRMAFTTKKLVSELTSSSAAVWA